MQNEKSIKDKILNESTFYLTKRQTKTAMGFQDSTKTLDDINLKDILKQGED